MTDTSAPIPERLVVRAMSNQILESIAGYCDLLNLDMVGVLVFTGVWTANTAHLTHADRFSMKMDLPPDHYRRPIRLEDLARRLRLSPDLVDDRLAQLEALDLVEIDDRGVWAPTGVFTRADMLAAFQAMIQNAAAMVDTLARHGITARAA